MVIWIVRGFATRRLLLGFGFSWFAGFWGLVLGVYIVIGLVVV